MSLTSPSDRPFFDDDAPVDETDELLVAYLDGELDETARRDLEDRLFADDSLRTRLAELQSGWEMLDQLPPASVTDDFARTTLEMAAARESQILQAHRRRRPIRTVAWVLGITTATVLATAAGFLIPRYWNRQQFYAQLDRVPLAEHLDAYLLDIDMPLIVQLSESPRWTGAMRLGTVSGGIASPEDLDLEQRERPEQIALIKSLDRDSQLVLSNNWERLHGLDEDQLRQVQSRYAAVQRQEDPDAILRTMSQYAAWWSQLPPESKEQIVRAAPDQRLEVILTTLERSSRYWLFNYAESLSETDRDLIYTTLLWIARDRIDRARQFQEAEDEDDERSRSRRRRPPFRIEDLTPEGLLFGMAGRASIEFGQRQRSGQPFDATSDRRRDPPPPPDASDEWARERWLNGLLFGSLTAEELARVEEVMSPRAMFLLNAEANSAEERREILWRWCFGIIMRKAPRVEGPEAMLKLYESLGPEYRDLLDLRPPDQLFNELRGHRRRW